MAFIPPGFQTLTGNTVNLDTVFTRLLNRYDIPKLDGLIANILALKDSKTARTAANDVLEKLANEYAGYSKTHTPGECNKVSKFLLGALIHRYFRIIKEYDYQNSFTSLLFFKTCSEKNCKLFAALRKALNLEFVNGKFPDKYKVKDLERMDATTIVTALTSFRDGMKKEDANKKPRYMQHPHFADPKNNFEMYLKEIISEHEPEALPVLQQYKAIQFVQSLSKYCEKEFKEVEEALMAWMVILKKDHPKFETLSMEQLEAHIKAKINPSVNEDPVRGKILTALKTKHIQANLSKFNHDSFHRNMLGAHLSKSQQALLGGYVVLLESKSVDRLKTCIYQALNIEKKPEDLTNDDKLNAVILLEGFLKTNPNAELDYEFFDGKVKFGSAVAVIREGIGKRVAAKIEDHKAAAPALAI